MIAMVTMVVVFDVNTVLPCLLIGVILLVLGVENEKEVILTMPWGTMGLVGSAGLLRMAADKMSGSAFGHYGAPWDSWRIESGCRDCAVKIYCIQTIGF